MFIAYDKKNGVEYGKACISKRVGSKVTKTYINLGRVIDKEKLIFSNRSRGIFTFDPSDGSFGTPDPSDIPLSEYGMRSEKYILDFGDVFLLDSFLRTDGLGAAVDAIGCGNPDTLYSLLCFHILCSMPGVHAQDWWEGSYARIRYPKADFNRRKRSGLLAAIGQEDQIKSFFRAYIPYVLSKTEGRMNVLIGSASLPNGTPFPLTALSGHKEDTGNEGRLICAVQQETGLPVYFRYVPDSAADVSALTETVAALETDGIRVQSVMLDADDYDEGNVRALCESNVSFITRLSKDQPLYRQLMSENLPGIGQEESLVGYNGRYAYIQKIPVELDSVRQAYAYLCLDIANPGHEVQSLPEGKEEAKMFRADVCQKMPDQELFILISSEEIAGDQILQRCYAKQQMVQIFGIDKNNTGTAPLPIRTEEVFRGHLLLTFIASVVVKRLEEKLNKTQYNPASMFLNMKNQKCKVYDGYAIVQKPSKKAAGFYNLFGIECPNRLSAD